MNQPPEDPERRHLPHLAPRGLPNQNLIQYVTVCVDRRRSLLANDRIAKLLVDHWTQADFWLVGRYMTMPDHVHFFCAPRKFPQIPVKDWAEYWCNMITRAWPHPVEKPIWQGDCFDRQMRSRQDYEEKCSYVRENPVRAGLVKRSEDWPYQGELNVLQWHNAS